MQLSARERSDVDRHITGNYGEDSVGDDPPEDPPEDPRSCFTRVAADEIDAGSDRLRWVVDLRRRLASGDEHRYWLAVDPSGKICDVRAGRVYRSSSLDHDRAVSSLLDAVDAAVRAVLDVDAWLPMADPSLWFERARGFREATVGDVVIVRRTGYSSDADVSYHAAVVAAQTTKRIGTRPVGSPINRMAGESRGYDRETGRPAGFAGFAKGFGSQSLVEDLSEVPGYADRIAASSGAKS